ncbi:acyl carrier protein [Nocardiopsis alba]|uniref:Acyl carrier protein n=1 Tax=Nocardiopsis alba TaxID=53437 RepID=A0A7K2IPH8_9ACTN|nr:MULTISPECIES: acyl carrier protein [Nocardiopsis]MEC3894059.1 acyl carrier protein [Nocardiopsis sp. LDBS1602]MYR31674.1 acyl carrier protein [Nocardiopsis alba]
MAEPLKMEEMVEIISTCAGVDTDPVTAATHTFEELGVDSLAVMGMVTEIEHRTGRRLAEGADSSPGPTDLLDLVNGTITKEA